MFARAATFMYKVLTRSVAVRLAGGYVALIVIILLVVALGLMNFHTIRGTYDEVLDTRLPRIAQLQKIKSDLAALSITAHASMLTEDKALLEKSLAAVDAGRLQMGEQLESLQKALEAENTELSKATAQGVSDRASGVLVGLVKFSRMVKAGKHDMAADSLRNGLQPELEKLGLLIGEYEKAQMTSLVAVKDSVGDLERSIIQRSIAIALAAIVLAAGFGYWVIRSVVAPLQRATRTARLMSKGNFTQRLTVGRFDEVGKVTSAFNEISDGMTDLVGVIRTEAAQIDSVTHSISERNQQLESGAQDLTVNLDKAAGYIRSVQSVIDDNVAHAQKATHTAGTMADIAQQSSASAADAVNEMALVKQSSQKITDIISLIDGITFQTNILALNAAVEAARAGEQGRGFAVVASEVRTLAGRSAAASKEIKDLILTSQKQVDSGTQKVQDIAKVIGNVKDAALELKGMVQHISDGSTEQSNQISHMVESVAKLESGNGKNVQSIDGLRLSLTNLTETAQQLILNVSKFQVNPNP